MIGHKPRRRIKFLRLCRMQECIFCLEGEDVERAILYNVKCRCNYCFHKSCYECYTKKNICPMCRGDVGELYVTVDSQASNACIIPSPLRSRSPISSPEHPELPTPSAPPPSPSQPQPLYQVTHAEIVPIIQSSDRIITPYAPRIRRSLCARVAVSLCCILMTAGFALIIYWIFTA